MTSVRLNSDLPEDLFTTNRAPSDEELAAAHTLIANLENQLCDPTTATADGGFTVSLSQNNILESLAELKNVVSPIRRVPADIIREVFLACLDPHTFPYMSSHGVPCTLSHISSGLRQIALSTPALWAAFHVRINRRSQTFSMRGSKPLESMLRGQAFWLDLWIHHRSGNLPLRISVNELGTEEPQDNMNDAINLVLSCHSRWRDIRFSYPFDTTYSQILASLKKFTPQDVPLLHNIDFGSILDEDETFFPVPLLACPSLKKLYGVSFQNIYELKSHLPLSTITELQCYFSGRWRPSLFADFANVLRLCVSLVNLDLHADVRGEIESIKPDVYLPHLRNLTIHENFARLRMLTAISAPQLESLDVHLDGTDYGSYTDHWPVEDIIGFFQRSPKIQVLRVGGPMQANTMLSILQYCPLLITLRPPPTTDRYSSWDFVWSRFVQIDTTQEVVCPKLQYLDIGYDSGLIITNFSTVKMLITCKLKPSPSLAPWKRLKIRFRYLEAEKEEADQMLALADSLRVIIEGVRPAAESNL